jgi:hypothetical protein
MDWTMGGYVWITVWRRVIGVTSTTGTILVVEPRLTDPEFMEWSQSWQLQRRLNGAAWTAKTIAAISRASSRRGTILYVSTVECGMENETESFLPPLRCLNDPLLEGNLSTFNGPRTSFPKLQDPSVGTNVEWFVFLRTMINRSFRRIGHASPLVWRGISVIQFEASSPFVELAE